MARPSYRAYGSATTASSSSTTSTTTTTTTSTYRYHHPSPNGGSNGGSSGSFHDPGGASIWDDIMAGARNAARRAWAYGRHGRGRRAAWDLAVRAARRLRRNLARRRLLAFPHLLVALWVLALLWGESWSFASKVNRCDWNHWEDWPPGATPHRLIFVADPQLIDPHSYPGRPWPLNPLTMRITDNYMRRSYIQLQKILRPDTVMFLGDLFDGGREWKTAHGDFDDPEWAKNHRPASEKKLLKQWNKKYGEQYWLKEYSRFGRIFFDNWLWGGITSTPFQRGRKIISSLPGNHDLGFGAEVKLPVRNRFNAYFGETNRVDVIGNHTFVSVDTVSLSADTSTMKDRVDLRGIYGPVNDFLDDVKVMKRRAVQKELRFWRGEVEEVTLHHKVEELEDADYSNLPTIDPGENAPDFPTILLTHVPLYRDPGTPCGPMREHWPPATPPKGQAGPVIPDHRNAISVSSGYQYQNVLSDEDSIKLIKDVGNVIHVFSGDDHDYCEVVHSPQKESVREITVKSFSMAMGVPTPGFQMVSLYNPIDAQGKPPPSSSGPTLQTHLCLLPNQLSMFMNYAILGVLSVLALVARAALVPTLKLQPFALEPIHSAPSAVLPVFKPKTDMEDENEWDRDSTSSATSASNLPSARFPSRTKGGPPPPPSATQVRDGDAMPYPAASAKSKGKSRAGPGKWGWAQSRGPRIQIRRDTYYDAKIRGDPWRPASARQRTALEVVVEEAWTSCWRVVWMVALLYGWLMWRG
ncbi:putative calcineurin-like phosphoesterase [Rosellinia necatrix]|uniref:Putative calcineurin-like phosphoesterase n=1 Tax=Rosellinia necatrix TaxID=77044 RepID=A0A1W2TKB6_ROSNE|nr:putative calcineurin-like phosphoesterase [Rosellinia necatrix]